MPNIKKVLVTGKNGQLGRSIKALSSQYPHYQFVFVGRDELNLSCSKNIADYFKNKQYDVIINCAAYTAVDKAEEQQDLAKAINHSAVKQLAEISKENGWVLIHISTDYVFDGANHKPYIESDLVNPQNIYGTSKLKGEQAIQQVGCKAAIIRTSWVYSEYGNNFVKTMLKLGVEREQLNVIFDQIGSPTYATDLALSLLAIVDSIDIDDTGFQQDIYHFSNEGACSWYDFAKAVFELSHTECAVFPIETKDYPTPAQRPHYSLLNKAKIKQQFKLNIPYWKDSLQTCLNKI